MTFVPCGSIRMSKRTLSGIGPAAVAALALLTLTSCASWKRVENKTASDPFERVSATLQADVDTVRQTLLDLPRTPHHSDDMLPGFPDLDLFLVAPHGDPSFPDDGSIRVNLNRSPWMETYLGLPPQERTQDIYLYIVTDLFWPSDHIYEEGPAKFYSDFIIHFEATSDTTTRVEVIEYLPRIWVGKSFQLGAHGPCMCRDQRWVEQTKGDRSALLQEIRNALREES